MFIVEKATPEDVLHFIELDKVENPGEIISNWGFKSLFRKSCYLVSVDNKAQGVDKQVLGFAIITEWGRERTRYLDELYITPDARSLGLGRLLVNESAAEELIVDDSNERALRFYKKLGFQIQSTWKGHDNKPLFHWLVCR